MIVQMLTFAQICYESVEISELSVVFIITEADPARRASLPIIVPTNLYPYKHVLQA